MIDKERWRDEGEKFLEFFFKFLDFFKFDKIDLNIFERVDDLQIFLNEDRFP